MIKAPRQIVKTRDELITDVTITMSNLFDNIPHNITDGNALVEELEQDPERGKHLRLTFDWWIDNPEDKPDEPT